VLHYRLHLALWYAVTLTVVLHLVVVGGYGLVIRHASPDFPGWTVFAPIAIPAILLISGSLGWWLA
jgi:hypothetical protein